MSILSCRYLEICQMDLSSALIGLSGTGILVGLSKNLSEIPILYKRMTPQCFFFKLPLHYSIYFNLIYFNSIQFYIVVNCFTRCLHFFT